MVGTESGRAQHETGEHREWRYEMKKYRVIGNGHPYRHFFDIGTIVTIKETARDGVSQYLDKAMDNPQWIGNDDVKEITPFLDRVAAAIKRLERK